MMSPPVTVSVERAGVAIVTLNRPERRNALSIGLLEGLSDAVEQLARGDKARVVILRGEGGVFCSGLDLKEARDERLRHQSAELVSRALLAVSQSPSVTIAAVEGAAVAGGAGLMSACDFVVAGQSARIGYPEVKRGLVAGLVLTFLRRQLAERDIRELLLLGDLIDAPKAMQIRLINRVVSDGEALHESLALAEQVLEGAPGAIARTKKVLEELSARSIADDLRIAHAHHLAARDSEESVEGIQAFLEKRPPRWFTNAKGS